MSRNSRIVVGFDGSPCSWAAAEYAAQQAVADDRTVRLAHTLLEPTVYAAMVSPDLVADPAIEARSLLEGARAELQSRYPSLVVQTCVVERAPGAMLVRESRSAELVVLGRLGHGRPAWGSAGFGRVHAGSLDAHVATYASCPVVIVGPDPVDPALPVVLGFDAAAPSAAATTFAFETAQRRGVGLRACTVSAPSAEPPAAQQDADLRRLVSEELAGWRTAFADVPVAVDVLQGMDPAARLLDAAAEASLVVVGARDRTGVEQPTLGPVGETLMRHARCPLAVVHPHRRDLHRDLRLPRAAAHN